MSTLVSDIAAEALAMVGDPRARRVSIEDQVMFLNRAQRMVVEKLTKVLETEATFNTEVADKYFYPLDCLQVTSVWYNPDPASDPDAYTQLSELKPEEMNRMISGTFPSGDPTFIHYRREFFQIAPRPAAAVSSGGKIIYWRYPSIISSVDPASGATLELPSYLDRLVIDAFKIRIYEKLKMFDEAVEARGIWESELNDIADISSDRGDDARQNIRPRSFVVGNSDQI